MLHGVVCVVQPCPACALLQRQQAWGLLGRALADAGDGPMLWQCPVCMLQRHTTVSAWHSHAGTYRKKSFYDPEMRQLRAKLRATYARLLLADMDVAACAEVEALLWKGIFYRPIEEFRARIRQVKKVRGLRGGRQLGWRRMPGGGCSCAHPHSAQLTPP